MTRPDTVVAVVGTGTEVGKTWVSAQLLGEARRRGLDVSARKPVQSFAPDDEATDADILAAATGERPEQVCPPELSLPAPFAPPMAAEILGLEPPSLSRLEAAIDWPEGTELGLVETVGGLLSPAAEDGDSLDIVSMVEPDITLLVAEPALGTINDCRLAALALAPLEPIVILNRFDPTDPLHNRNRAWLGDRCELAVHEVGADGSWVGALLSGIVGPGRSGHLGRASPIRDTAR